MQGKRVQEAQAMLRDVTHDVPQAGLGHDVRKARRPLEPKRVAPIILRRLSRRVVLVTLGLGGAAHRREQGEHMRSDTGHEGLSTWSFSPSGHVLTRRWCGKMRSAAYVFFSTLSQA